MKLSLTLTLLLLCISVFGQKYIVDSKNKQIDLSIIEVKGNSVPHPRVTKGKAIMMGVDLLNDWLQKKVEEKLLNSLIKTTYNNAPFYSKVVLQLDKLEFDNSSYVEALYVGVGSNVTEAVAQSLRMPSIRKAKPEVFNSPAAVNNGYFVTLERRPDTLIISKVFADIKLTYRNGRKLLDDETMREAQNLPKTDVQYPANYSSAIQWNSIFNTFRTDLPSLKASEFETLNSEFAALEKQFNKDYNTLRNHQRQMAKLQTLNNLAELATTINSFYEAKKSSELNELMTREKQDYQKQIQNQQKYIDKALNDFKNSQNQLQESNRKLNEFIMNNNLNSRPLKVIIINGKVDYKKEPLFKNNGLM